jgi:hypothetical protein
MKFGLFIALMLAPAWVFAAGVEKLGKAVPHCNQAPRAWLGLRVSKPDETITAHVPSLPPGVGFVVDAVDSGGPAEAAGLRALDLLWKFGDQMLVNEAQLATLLRLAKPGDEVALHGFRGGQPLEVMLTLGDAPQRRAPLGGEFAETAVLPGACAGPMRVVNVSERVASFTADEGTASVQREGNGYQVRIDGPAAERIFRGTLTPEAGIEAVPEPWRRRILVLCRTLDQAITEGGASARQPRPRVVPPSGETR